MTSEVVGRTLRRRVNRQATIGRRLGRASIYLVLFLGGIVMAFPFFWMLVTSFQSQQESLTPRPVFWPQRLHPVNWLSAYRLGAEGGDPWWGGLKPGTTATLTVSAGAGGTLEPLRVSIPGNINSDTTALLFAQSAGSKDPRVPYSSPGRRAGNRVVWDIRVANTGQDFQTKAPIKIGFPDGAVDLKADLEADAVSRDDLGPTLEWSNLAPGGLGYVFQNFRDALRTAPFGRYFLNSLITAGLQTMASLIVVTLAAFAFARIKFRGSGIIFALILTSLMIPGEVLLVPNYVIVSKLSWLNSYQGLVVPWIASVFGIFLLRQFFLAMPAELFEAAVIDGAGQGTLLWRVGLPLAAPGLVTFGLFCFLGSWNALLWPLVATSSQDMRTLQVGLQAFVGEAGTQYGQLMAASLMVVSPILVGFFFAQKQFIAGVARSGLK